MTYSVDIYTGKQIFQKDYANVLEFETPQDRDQFFTSKSHITLSDTDFVHVGDNSTSLTITFDEVLDTLDLKNFQYESVTYCRINYELVTPMTGEVNAQSKYYFVDSYRIVSSTSNRTVVKFHITEDIWTNYQFGVKFRPTNVERKHLDRWKSSSDKPVFYTPRDQLVQTNVKSTTSEIRPLNTGREFMYVTGVETEEDTSEPASIDWISRYDIERVRPSVQKMMWCVVSYTNTFEDEPDQSLVQIFPVMIPNDSAFSDKTPLLRDVIHNQVFWNDDEYREQEDLAYYVMNGTMFPSYGMVKSGLLQDVLRDENNFDVQIYNIQMFETLPIQLITDVNDDITEVRWTPTGLNLSQYTCEKSLQMRDKTDKVNGEPVENRTDIYRQFFKIPVITDTVQLTFLTSLGEYHQYNDQSIIIPYPQKPNDGTLSSELYEPMLYRQPVRSYHLVSRDNISKTQIPDSVMYNAFTPSQSSPQAVSRLWYNVKFDTQKCEVNYVLAHSITQNDELVTDLSMLGFSLKRDAMQQDILNDYFREYCVRQRDIDRQMMWTNIATGGIQEQGSTQVSAGIGYRSNMERQELSELQNEYLTSGAPITSAQLRQESEMYQSYQKQQMRMSVLGGGTAFGQNAIHQMMQQQAKERSIQNMPQDISQVGNWKYVFTNDLFGFKFIILRCDDESLARYYNLFRMYGYHVGTVLDKIDLKSRKYFDYIKTNGQCIDTPYNQYIQSQLCTIFDRGVTIWHMDKCTEDYIENSPYRYENIERSLMNEE